MKTITVFYPSLYSGKGFLFITTLCLSILFFSSPASAQIIIGGEDDSGKQLEEKVEQVEQPQGTAESTQPEGIKTLFDNDRPISSGGYGAFQMKFSEYLGDGALLLGGKGGWVINHRFVLGGGGYGLSNSIFNEKVADNHPIPNARARLQMGYGGVLLEPIAMHDKVFHLSFPILIGGGGAEYQIFDPGNVFNSTIRSDGFFFVEPGIDLEINVLYWMRINVGMSYLYTSNIDLPDTPDDVFRTLAGNLTFKFGKF